MAFSNETRRFILMMDATVLQATMLKDNPIMKQRLLQIFNRFFGFGRQLSKMLQQYAENKGQPGIDDEAAFIYEAMREICDSKNKAEALALLREYNQGNVIIEP